MLVEKGKENIYFVNVAKVREMKMSGKNSRVATQLTRLRHLRLQRRIDRKNCFFD